MLCRKVLRSVIKPSQLRLGVRIVTQFGAMDDLQTRTAHNSNTNSSSSGVGVGSPVLPRTQNLGTAATSMVELQHSNGAPLEAPITPTAPTTATATAAAPAAASVTVNDGVLFADLVFYPKGRERSDSRDKETLARELAEFHEAVEMFTQIKPNAQSIRDSISNLKLNSLRDTIKYLERSGLTLSAVEKLSVIHVAGTKGKGSTCALTESILRQYGVRTGFFSSPHLVSITERFRINGVPLARNKFTRHFWHVYNNLMSKREYDKDMPPFFMFLTILGFHAFLEERVDVVVLEVGIGGECDCTNVLRNVKTVGITSLALEHTDLLGTTIKQIAWQKGGIIKPGSNVYTHVTDPVCLEVIRERVAEKKATLHQVLETEAYFKYNLYAHYFDTFNDYVRLNGALAIQLAYDWLRQAKGRFHEDNPINDLHMTTEVLRGLVTAHWPGRCQLVEYNHMRVHLDGAHTVESMRICLDWYIKSTKRTPSNPKILIFNRTGGSDPSGIVNLVHNAINFDMVCFTPNIAHPQKRDPSQSTKYTSARQQRHRAQIIAKVWESMSEAKQQINKGQLYNTCFEALTAVRARYPAPIELDLLVTGSIHLLGAVITAIDQFQSPVQATATSTAASPSSSIQSATIPVVDRSPVSELKCENLSKF
ncbi:folylpolyglutamate synthase, mitochondrial [Drosophila nasuta]|uniref:folylpolyglutamate synthase, mitochondrial n=1 Tax=Drosophila nasuta TaxID=42062 RepID=UPI00295E4B95|nr:folylpolyglutamate synthase, mitochondrial [Drosophila nasuta]